jgi:hypothetical protein
MSLLGQQRSAIRYFVLRGKENQQIAAKLVKGYVSGPCRSGRPDFTPGSTTLKTTIDSDDRFQRIFAMLFSVFLRKNVLFIARCQQGALYPENNNSPRDVAAMGC